MAFHEVRFPASLSYGSMGGPERRTNVVTLANGFEERNSPWSHSRRRYDAGLGLRSLDDIEALIAFFEARQGQLYGFRWKDWADYRSGRASEPVAPTDQEIGQGDGSSRVFQLQKTYRSGAQSYVRPITKPVAETVRVAFDGVEQTEGLAVDSANGQLVFTDAPGAGVNITAGFEFDVPVRFDTDRIVSSVASFQAGDVPDVPVVELRV